MQLFWEHRGRNYLYENYLPGGNPDFRDLPQIIARVWSLGPDGLDGTTDDISMEIKTDELFSMVSGNMLDEDGAAVTFRGINLIYPNGIGLQTYAVALGTNL